MFTKDMVVSPENADASEPHKDSEEAQYYFWKGTKEMFFGGSMNLLLFCIPVAFVVGEMKGINPAVVFIFSLLSIAPLAERLGYVTEQIALHTNQTLGGLLNATFGNATELIVAVVALFKGEIRVVQLSLLGSILSNMLLVLGTAFMLGGSYHKVQTFSKISTQMNMILLMLAVMGLIFPSIMRDSELVSATGQLYFSRVTCIYLFLVYGAFLYFQLFSHSHLYEDGAEEIGPATPAHEPKLEPKTGEVVSTPSQPAEVSNVEQEDTKEAPVAAIECEKKSDTEEEEEEDVLGVRYALVWLALITVLIAFLSEFLVTAIEGTGTALNINPIFLSVIVIPIIGNAAEHAGAIVFAMKNKLDLTLGIAVGSSTQIALMVLPLLVLIGWIGDINLDLNFQSFEAYTLFLCVVIVTFACKDGDSNWLTGLSLVTSYFIISTAFFVHLPENLSER